MDETNQISHLEFGDLFLWTMSNVHTHTHTHTHTHMRTYTHTQPYTHTRTHTHTKLDDKICEQLDPE